MQEHEPSYRWAPIIGDFHFDNRSVVFRGGTSQYGEETGSALGTAISDQWFAGGVVRANVAFTSPTPKSACDIILAYNPSTRAFVGAGIRSGTCLRRPEIPGACFRTRSTDLRQGCGVHS